MQTAVAPQINSYTFKIKHLTVFTQRWEENVYCNFTLFFVAVNKNEDIKICNGNVQFRHFEIYGKSFGEKKNQI